ncbi:MXAN_2562 family outer membrane beta-barrel protein [Archangium lansingense]|uniref:MXAN_2562 family outer membrane beta-barrel protein n=1 Tax=Archangium lansingense TaxID=2995310 RepID=A0ABT4A495_9BACT|nr:MXAN_2562 family outer membrane beta-barrel protein [Archangium lansinium]MCY1076467.1 MXAN_2562 family outer membrane beta-barrel protein [Archangium lansinium]
MTRAVALGVAVVLTALPGMAQETSDVPNQSPRSGSVEFRLGGYRPALDSEAALNGATPFKDIFGTSNMLLFELEMQRFFYQGIGTAGVSVSAGYAEKYGDALTQANDPSAERTGIHVVPLRVRGVYRFDYPAFYWGIPLVPYVKPGLVFSPWWVTKGGKIEAPAVGGQGRGMRFGWEVVGGIAFMLDVLEPRLARDFDSDLGVNHSYLFAEYTYSKVNNFGSKGFDLSDSYWMFGLALDY